jgi:hypothetical protein
MAAIFDLHVVCPKFVAFRGPNDQQDTLRKPKVSSLRVYIYIQDTLRKPELHLFLSLSRTLELSNSRILKLVAL